MNTDSDAIPSRVNLNDRRRYLVQQIRSRGILSYARYNLRFGNPSSSTLKEDVKFLDQLGFSIEMIEFEGRRFLIDKLSKRKHLNAFRTDLNRLSKEAIGLMSASLLLGVIDKDSAPLPPGEHDKLTLRERQNYKEAKAAQIQARITKDNPEMLHLFSRSEITGELSNKGLQAEASVHAILVRRKLEKLWTDQATRIFCDAGSTVDRISYWLQDLLVPTCFSSLSSLTVCTNSSNIFEVLGDPEIPIQTLLVGGTQVISSQCFAGIYSELFLQAAEKLLGVSVAFIGATAIDLENDCILSDSYEEKQLKSLVFGNSLLKVVCVDSSKFTLEGNVESFPFASLHPSQVDLIITNSYNAEDGRSETAHDDAISRIRSKGVPVITAGKFNHLQKATALSRGKEMRLRVSYNDYETFLARHSFESEGAKSYIFEALLNMIIKANDETDSRTVSDMMLELKALYPDGFNSSSKES